MNLSDRKYNLDNTHEQVPQRWNSRYTDKVFRELDRGRSGWVTSLLRKALT